MIGRCLEAIPADARPGDQVLVVADRCTDETAAIARRFGASVLERGPDEEPGRAAARQAGLEHARALEWDAVVMLDADSVIAPGFFDACERALGREVEAVQARSESRRGRTLATEASLAAFALQGITIPRGRDRLGFSARLRGTGMAIRRDWRSRIASARPPPRTSSSPSTCCSTGSAAATSTPRGCAPRAPARWSTFGGQKVRYEAGRMAAARAYVPRLLRRAVRTATRRARGGLVPRHAAVRARRALAARRARGRRAGAGLAAGGALRRRACSRSHW